MAEEMMAEQAPGQEQAPAEGGNELSTLITGIVDSMATLGQILEESAGQVDPQGKEQVMQAAQMFQDGIAKLTGGAPAEQASNKAVPVQAPEGMPVGPQG